ncbi:MAG: Type 1 glutamine amidotransferase-like domain-containing protein, partial [Chloroflexota bacterium]|nr:Type 1 glutamine amidotransferase-like domain-containing protein [Chloroflexota bacterium]
MTDVGRRAPELIGNGLVALHGGGEFLPGDERFLGAILEAAPRTARIVRAAVVPTAAARGRPADAAEFAIRALGRIGASLELTVDAQAAAVVDPASANDPGLAAFLAEADLIHFPGGDPDLIPAVLPGTAAWAAVLTALGRGAVLAGASAGAMALGSWTWTPGGVVQGLGMIPGIVVVPHADARSWADNLRRFGGMAPSGAAVLGIGERTGVLIRATEPWQIVGEAEVRWLAPGQHDLDAALVL